MRQFLFLAIVASMSFGEMTIGEKEATTKPDSSNPVYVNHGDILKIRLPIRGGTGYRWSILGYDNGATEILGQSTIEKDDDSEDREGGPEYQVYKFKVKLKGPKTTRLTFIKITPDKDIADPPQVLRFYLVGIASPPYPATTSDKVLTETEATYSTDIRIQDGDTITVRLNVQPEKNLYQVSNIDKDVLEQDGNYVLEYNPKNKPGTITLWRQQVFRFKVKKAAKSKLQFTGTKSATITYQFIPTGKEKE